MPPIEIEFSIADKRNKVSTTSVKVAQTETDARVALFGVAWAEAIDNLIGGVIRGATAILNVAIETLTITPAASSSDVEEIGAFHFITDDDGTDVEINIPSLNEVLVINESGEIDQSLSAVQAFLAMMEDGLDVGGVDTFFPTNIQEGGGFVLQSARERSRNSGKRKVNN